MHIMGKVFLWLAVIGAIAAVVLTAKAFDVRSGYLKQVAERQEEIEKNDAQYQDLRKKVDLLLGDITRRQLDWGQFWDNVETGIVDQGQGTVSVSIGLNQGLGRTADESNADPVVIYGFQPQADGSYSYVGAFQVATARENQSALKPTFRIRPGTTASWRPGNWRWRTVIPADYIALFSDLDVKFAVSDQLLAAKQRHLEIQNELATKAAEQLQTRLDELLGSDETRANADKLPVELVEGYRIGVDQAISERDAAQAEVDRLRRELKTKHDQLLQLVEANQKLAQELPGSEPTPPVTLSTATPAVVP